jgi:hypothetical protein
MGATTLIALHTEAKTRAKIKVLDGCSNIVNYISYYHLDNSKVS